MALVVKDRVKETSTTTGTGTITLAGSSIGFQSFSVIGDGNTTYYAISNRGTSEWEVGVGTYTLSGTTLSRDTVLQSSNNGNKVDFSSGTKDIFVTQPAARAVYVVDNVLVPSNNAILPVANGGTGSSTVAGAQTALQVDPAGTAVSMAIALG